MVLVPRSNRPKRTKSGKNSEPEPMNLDVVRFGLKTSTVKRGVEYTVQTTTGALADDGKTWVCPECGISIAKGTAHTVAWDAVRGVDTRRHFHNHCWKVFQGPLL
jgi:hypothetical protein